MNSCNTVILLATTIICSLSFLEDRCINDVTVNFFTSFLYKTNRFHVAVSHRKRQNVLRTMTHSPNGSCATFLFSPHIDVICDLLLNRRTATWNLFVLYNNKKIKIHEKNAFLFETWPL